jgi:hypothetical protein
MSNRNHSSAGYERPQVADYGTLRDLTAQFDSAMPMGMNVAGLGSLPTGPPPGGPDGPGGPPGGPSGGATPLGGSGPELLPDAGAVGGSETSEKPGGSGVAGAEGGGGGAGGAVSTGGGDASLPFTGFPALVAGAVGAGMAAAGTALRRSLRRK